MRLPALIALALVATPAVSGCDDNNNDVTPPALLPSAQDITIELPGAPAPFVLSNYDDTLQDINMQNGWLPVHNPWLKNEVSSATPNTEFYPNIVAFMSDGTSARLASTLYTQTYGGRIGIVHGLTKDECETQRKQALSEPATGEEKAAAKMFADEAAARDAQAAKDAEMARRRLAANGFVIADHGVPWSVSETSAVVRITSDVRYAECRDKPLP